MTVESHRSAATLYAAGELTTAGVLQAAAWIEGLPEQVPTPHHAPRLRQTFGFRIRDYRQAVVTRSLRERAGSETR
jgi:hypothetical protein